MSKAKLDVMVMIIAFLIGGFISANSNPLIGTTMLIAILGAWSLAPKVPVVIPALIKVRNKK